MIKVHIEQSLLIILSDQSYLAVLILWLMSYLLIHANSKSCSECRSIMYLYSLARNLTISVLARSLQYAMFPSFQMRYLGLLYIYLPMGVALTE